MVVKYDDIFSGFFLLLVSAIMFLTTFSFEALTTSRVGPAFMPQIIAVIMAVFSIIIVANGFMKTKKVKIEEDFHEPVEVEDKETPLIVTEKKSYKSVLLTLGLMIGYLVLMPFVGFLIMTALYVFLQMMILSHVTNRKIWLFIIISVVTSAVIYYLFRSVFYVMLPTGIIG